MSNPFQSFIDVFKMNAYHVDLVLEQVTEDQAKERLLGGGRNSLRWLIGHLIWDRSALLKTLGADPEYPWDDYFKSDKVHTDGTEYPSMGEIKKEWDRVHSLLIGKLESLDAADAQRTGPQLPHQQPTLMGAAAFWLWQDCYHVGQIGSLRTLLGLNPLKQAYHDAQTALA